MMPPPTSLPYWDLLPLENDPVGGWVFHRVDEVNISFQYPSIYQNGNCGAIFTEYKVIDDYQGLLIGFAGSSIRIHIYDQWGSELDETSREGHAPEHGKLVTDVERFSIGGIPAVRYVSMIPDSKTLDYNKTAIAYYRDRVYVFSFANLTYFSSCEAPPLTEEQVYEYMLSTLEFLE
jgi:hypothetical protein